MELTRIRIITKELRAKKPKTARGYPSTIFMAYGKAPVFLHKFYSILLSDDKDVLWRSASALNLGNLGVCKVTTYQDERRCDIVEVKSAQVRNVLTATEHTE